MMSIYDFVEAVDRNSINIIQILSGKWDIDKLFPNHGRKIQVEETFCSDSQTHQRTQEFVHFQMNSGSGRRIQDPFFSIQTIIDFLVWRWNSKL